MDEFERHGTDEHTRAESHDQPEQATADREPKGDEAAEHKRGTCDGAPQECLAHQS